MTNDTETIFVLDTSAWFTLVEGEEGADTVRDLLRRAERGEVVVLVSFMTYMEVYYITYQKRGMDVARERLWLIGATATVRVESNPALGLLAAENKVNHHMSVADSWIAALAAERGATLMHKDPEYEQMDGVIKLRALPYK